MFPYFDFIVGFIAFVYLLETYLELRQRRRFYEKTIPKEVEHAINQEKFNKNQAYGLDRSTFSLIQDNFNLIHTLLILFLGLIPFLWNWCEHILVRFNLPSGEMAVSMLFVVVAYLEGVIVHMPFELYSTFVLEEKYGFNKQTLRLFFMDEVKSFALAMAIGLPVLYAVLTLIRWGGELFWLYVWVFLLMVSLVMLTIYPIYIAPLFNKFTPLEEGSLKNKIEALAKSLNFPLTRLFVMDASKRSAHSNAYYYGFFKNKRIVLYDTLLKQVSEDEIVAILAHELGHWAKYHNLQNFVIAQAHMLVFLYVFGQMMNNHDIYEAFGFHDKYPLLIGLALFSFLYGPVEHALGLAMNFLSRHFEYQADAFSVSLGYDLGPALVKIHIENMGTLTPDPIYSAYHYSHPTLVERLGYIEKLKQEGKAGKRKTT